MAIEHDRLIRKLQSIGQLTPAEEAAISRLAMDLRTVQENADIVREYDTATECCVLIDGMLCRYKLLDEGQRQILSFHTPGDIPDLQSLHLKVMDHSVGTLTPATVALVPHTVLRDLIAAHPGIGSLLWRDTLIDASIFREWLLNIGRRFAHARIAHLFCELFCRLNAVGLADDSRMVLPLTQTELGDALGLSSVHVNRMLQDLRKDGLIESQGRNVKITDWPRLQQVGGFDPSYLHLRTGG